MLYWFFVKTVGAFARRRFSPTVIGVENVPKHGAAIIASNHLAAIDDAVIPITTPRMVHFMGKEEYFNRKGFKGFLSKFFFTSVGVFPVDRSGGSNSLGALQSAQRVLEKGEIFGLHPEGTRSPDGKLYRGHTGIARLAYVTGAPIIPVGIVGTDKAQPLGTFFPKKVKTRITFGKPIIVKKIPADQMTHDMIRELTDRVMEAIAQLSGQEYVDMYAQDRKKELAAQFQKTDKE
jgi:1-acyl-sn-glycerol-3-phosphate acyltransferase